MTELSDKIDVVRTRVEALRQVMIYEKQGAHVAELDGVLVDITHVHTLARVEATKLRNRDAMITSHSNTIATREQTIANNAARIAEIEPLEVIRQERVDTLQVETTQQRVTIGELQAEIVALKAAAGGS